MSNRSEATHPGPPAIASSFTLYAASISPSMVTSRLTYFPPRSTPPKFCAAPRAVLLECTSANSNFCCWHIATPAAHKPTNAIFFISPSNVLLIRRRPLDPVDHQKIHRPLGRLQLEPNCSSSAIMKLVPVGWEPIPKSICDALHTCRHLYSIDDKRK